MAGLLLMGCYWPEIQAAKAADIKNFGTPHFNGGVASIFCVYPVRDVSSRSQPCFGFANTTLRTPTKPIKATSSSKSSSSTLSSAS